MMSRLRLWQYGTTGALLLASALVVILARQQAQLRKQLAETQRLARHLHSGAVVPAFRAASLDGGSITVGEAADTLARQLVFVFNTTCPYCQATLPVWAKLADSARRLTPWHVQVMGISLDSAPVTRGYADKHRIGYPLLAFPNRRFVRLYRATEVPQTIVLDNQGTVIYARLGLLTDRTVIDSIHGALTWQRGTAGQSTAAATQSR